MRKVQFVFCVLMLSASFICSASDALSPGIVKELSYRGGWIMFQVKSDSGINYCGECPTDPGGLGSGRCWIEENKNAQLSMLLSAQARNKKIYGRVGSLNSSCNVYQMTVGD